MLRSASGSDRILPALFVLFGLPLALWIDFRGGFHRIQELLVDSRNSASRRLGHPYKPSTRGSVPLIRWEQRPADVPGLEATRANIARDTTEAAKGRPTLAVDVTFSGPRDPTDDAEALEVWTASQDLPRLIFANADAVVQDGSEAERCLRVLSDVDDILPPQIRHATAHLTPIDPLADRDGVVRTVALCSRISGSGAGPHEETRPLWLAASGVSQKSLEPFTTRGGDLYLPVPPEAASDQALGITICAPGTNCREGSPAIWGEPSKTDFHRLSGSALLSGAAIHAWLASAARDSAFPAPMPLFFDGILAFTALALIFFAEKAQKARWFLILTFVVLGVHLLTGHLLLAWGNRMMTGSALYLLIWIAAPVSIARRSARDYRERLTDRINLERYFPRWVLSDILSNPDRLQPRGQRARATLLYSDVRGFTTHVERLSPEDVFSHLNDYFAVVSEVIDDHGGSIQHFVGDQVLAFWGVPLTLEASDAASRAVATALELHERLERFRDEKGPEFGPMFRSGFGIVTGEIIAGNLGSVRRFDYGLVGDVVNLGARVESLTKQFGVAVLADADTATAVERTYPVRRIGSVIVAGRSSTTVLYEILTDTSEPRLEDARTYEQALWFAEQGELQEALSLLKQTGLPGRDRAGSVLFEHINRSSGPLLPFQFGK